MRTGKRLGISLVAAAAVLALAPATALAGSAPAGLQHNPLGAFHTGVYPNLFAHDGHSAPQIKAKLDAAWNQLFHGDPGTAPTHDDGQTLYYQLTPDMAYVEDIGNQDVRTEGMGYAMMIALQTNHKREFDSLRTFAKTKMQLQSGPTKYYFAWHTDTTGKIIDPGVAPDGDQWITAALTFASARWGDGSGIYDYGQQAKQILHAMWHESDTGGVNNVRRDALPAAVHPTSHLPLLHRPVLRAARLLPDLRDDGPSRQGTVGQGHRRGRDDLADVSEPADRAGAGLLHLRRQAVPGAMGPVEP